MPTVKSYERHPNQPSAVPNVPSVISTSGDSGCRIRQRSVSFDAAIFHSPSSMTYSSSYSPA